MRYLLFILAFILFGGQVALAQVNSNAFSIRTSIISDIIPPTTPILISVNPLASTQINLSWSAATDNYLVSGYSVFRDGTPIATTTLLSYSDTGLTASTTYTYFIRAFDIALNYSSSSNSLSTTTPNLPPPTPPTNTNSGQQEGTIARVVLENFWISRGLSTTSLHIETAHPARVEVRWGRTTSYELGYVVSDVYRKEHEVLLTDLEPGTNYEYEVIGYTPYGTPHIIKSGSFTTLNQTSVISPTNVGRFQAVQDGDDVNLSWQLPADDSISYVRIVRSHLGFPLYPQDGAVVYQGGNEGTRDMGVLAQYSPVYYTAFVYDIAGNISSGAVALVYAARIADSSTIEGSVPGDFTPVIQVPVVTEEATSSINMDRVTIEMKMPQPSDIVIIQNDREYSLIDADIDLNSKQDFLISIPSTAITGNLKSIIVTILDPTDNRNAYSYLLRINQDQTAYRATVPALDVVGRSQIMVEIYDYEALVVATYQTPITLILLEDPDGVAAVFPDILFKHSVVLWSVLALFLVFALIFFLVYRRRGEDK